MFNKGDIIKGLYNYKIYNEDHYRKCTRNETTGEFILLNDINEYKIEIFERKPEFDDLLDCINVSETLKNDKTIEYIKNLHNYINSYNHLFINQSTLADIMYSGNFQQEIIYKSSIKNKNDSIKTYLLPSNILGAYLIKLNHDNKLEKYIKIG